MTTSLDPQTLKKQAEDAFRAKKYAQAAQLFEAAGKSYAERNEIVSAAEMASSRSVALLQAGDAAAALEATQGVDRVFALSGDRKKQALALGNEAAALEGVGKNDQALEKYRQCADLLKEVGDNDTRAVVLKSISQLQMRTGHQLEALASMDSALDNKKKLSAPEKLLQKLLKVPFSMLNRH